MKSMFLSFVLYYGLLANADQPPFLGKWHNVSKSSAIEEVVFFPDNNVRLSNDTYAFHQRYSLSPTNIGTDNSFNGVFRIVNLGKLVKESKVNLRLLEKDLMELQIDDKKIVLKKN